MQSFLTALLARRSRGLATGALPVLLVLGLVFSATAQPAAEPPSGRPFVLTVPAGAAPKAGLNARPGAEAAAVLTLARQRLGLTAPTTRPTICATSCSPTATSGWCSTRTTSTACSGKTRS